jgi:hypothetical protein
VTDDPPQALDQKNFNLDLKHQLDVVPRLRIHNTHSVTNIIRNIEECVKTSHQRNMCLHACFLSQLEPKKVDEALKDSHWIQAMQEELLQFKR